MVKMPVAHVCTPPTVWPQGSVETEKQTTQPNKAYEVTLAASDIEDFVLGLYLLINEGQHDPQAGFQSVRIVIEDANVAEASSAGSGIAGSYPHFTAVTVQHLTAETVITFASANSAGKPVKQKYSWCLIHAD